MAQMEVILLERVEKLGRMGEVVKVRQGFARNFLLPQRKALRATKDNLARFEAKRADLEAANLKAKGEAEGVATKMNGLLVTLIRAASESGQLYGSVTARDIAVAVTEAGSAIDRAQVLMDKPVKTLGIFDIRVRLHAEVSVFVKVNIAQSQDEAAAQAERLSKGLPPVLTAAEQDAEEARQAAEEQSAAIAAAAAEAEADEDEEQAG
jgi:large subunit ribosomal protein L9